MNESLSVPLIEALSDAWTAIQRNHPSVPNVVILAAPNMHRRGGVLGHFAALRWSPGQGSNTFLHEVVVVAEHLDRSAVDIFETVLHEAVHAMNFAAGIRDCSANQYHNQKFRDGAVSLGLIVQKVEHYGWAYTRLAAGTESRYATPIAELDRVLIHRRSLAAPKGTGSTNGTKGGDADTASSSRSRKATCPCGYIIRVAKKTLEDTVIRCESCEQPFSLA